MLFLSFCITFALEFKQKDSKKDMMDSKQIRKIGFTKMHGAGNDYIYVNSMLHDIPDPAQAAVMMSDRHKGIGSDGLVLIGISPVPEADF